MVTARVACLVLALAVAGCGGDDNDGSPASPGGGTTPVGPAVLSGVFLDAAVEGLAYSTPTRSGTTNSAGDFEYLAGETVTFTLYGQEIGQVIGGATITPLNLQGASNHPDYALNVSRILQTMDSDSNLANGITLGAVPGVMNLNFNQSASAFESDSAVTGFIGTRTLVTAAAAISHLTSTIAAGNATYSLALVNRTATSKITASFCPGAEGGFSYTFSSTGITAVGKDSFVSSQQACVISPGAPENIAEAYAAFADSALGCGPNCSFSSLNKIVTNQTDIDGRTYNLVVQHVPGSNTIVSVKTITAEVQPSPPLPYTFREVIVLN